MCSLDKRLLQQRIVIKIDLADRQIVRGAPVRVDQRPLGIRQHIWHFSTPVIVKTATGTYNCPAILNRCRLR